MPKRTFKKDLIYYIIFETIANLPSLILSPTIVQFSHFMSLPGIQPEILHHWIT